MSTDIHNMLSQISPSSLLTLFKIALAYVNAGEDDNPEGLGDRPSSFVASREDFPEWGSFSASEQGIAERLVALENREVLLQEGWRCECCYGRQG